MYVHSKMSNSNYHQPQQQQPQQQQQHNQFQFSQNYQNMPLTAIPHSSQYNNMSQHQNNIQYHSVPSSPMNQGSQQSVFQFNPNMVAQQLKQSVLNQTNPNTQNNSNTASNERSFNFDVSTDNNSHSIQKQKMPDEEKEDTFVTSKQYSENDVEMVQEILNDMIQKDKNVVESSEELNLSGFDENLMVSETESQQIKQENCEANGSINDNQNNSYSPNNSSSGSHSSMLNDSVSSGILCAENKLPNNYTDNQCKARDK